MTAICEFHHVARAGLFAPERRRRQHGVGTDRWNCRFPVNVTALYSNEKLDHWRRN